MATAHNITPLAPAEIDQQIPLASQVGGHPGGHVFSRRLYDYQALSARREGVLRSDARCTRRQCDGQVTDTLPGV